jgi:hypothetical protein
MVRFAVIAAALLSPLATQVVNVTDTAAPGTAWVEPGVNI